MKKLVLFIFSTAMACMILGAAPAPIVFDTPAADEKGIMILGNGELGAVVWLTADGTLHTVLQNSDNWNEGGRHVKTGAIDYVTEMPVDKGTFHQELSMERGEFEASWKSGGKDVSVRYRVQHGTDSIVACNVNGAPKCEAKVVNWRLYPGGSKVFGVGEYELGNRFDESYFSDNVKGLKFSVSADRLVPYGWCHVNDNKTVAKMMKVYDYYQATGDLGKEDLLSNRVFGGITRKVAKDNRVLFLSAITCLHPCKDAAEWQRRTEAMLDACGWTLEGEAAKRAEHVAAWRSFWDRSHVEVSPAKSASRERPKFKLTINPKLPLGFGVDSRGKNKFVGSFGQTEVVFGSRTAFSGVPKPGERIASPKASDADGGFRFRCRFTTKDARRSQRILDNMTPGGSDGFIIDVYQGRVRMIMGRNTFNHPSKPQSGREVSLAVDITEKGEVQIVVDGVPLKGSIDRAFSLAEECHAITTTYAAQRYMTACAGKGRLPIRFNGSLFTISHNGDWDYRRWGNGFWWQNTRLPYYAMFAAGDVDMTDPLFKMYFGFLEFNKKRTRKYLGHGGAYFPECVQPWGDHFIGSYGPECEWSLRKDKLQHHRCHKYAWVGQLELSLLAIMRWEHTQDDAWFKSEALPSIREFVRYFDEHYKLDAKGRYHMYPAQAIETWRDCTNPMTEVSGLYGVTERLLAMPESVIAKEDRELFSKIRSRLPDLPTRKLEDGSIAYAPAERFAGKGNYETPELYCVFPFRVCSFEKPNADLGRRAYDVRLDTLYFGWSQDEVNAAYLGMTEEARVHIADRALTHSKPQYRWPAYWGPNFNWCPDGDEGGIYQTAIQSMLLQYDGRMIFLLPAWPKDWDCSFKLHAPYNTTVEGRVENGKLKDLVVTPASRRADVVVMGAMAGLGVEKQRYTPIDGGFEIEGGEAEFNRPLYGWHGDDEKRVTRFYAMTSDRPEVSVQDYPRPRHLGRLSFGDGTEQVRFRYVRGRAEYDLKGKGTVRMARSPDVPDLLVETTDGIKAEWDGEWTQRAKSQKDGKTYYAFARKGCKAPPPADIPAALEKAVAHLESLSRELVVKTPDKVLDALVACNGVAMDAEMEGDGIASGATSWRNPFPGWRVGYALTALGRDEAFKAFVRYHLKSQKKDGRVPCNVGGDSVYNFNEEFADAVVRHWLRTGDDAFMRDCAYEGVKKHLQWMENNMCVPGTQLFENWLNEWNTDNKWCNGGAGTIACAYARFAYWNLARVADRLGKTEDAKAFRARAAEIDAAVDKSLWSEKDGIWGEYRERFGLGRLITSPDASTIYTAIDSGLADADPSRAVRALAWYERNTPSEFTPDGQSVIYSSNKLPKFYSSCGLYPAENLHLALAHWQTGETEMAWRHFRSSYFQVVRGPKAGPGALYHVHRNGSLENIGDCDFTDTIAMHFRDVVEGLFGIVIDAPSGKATIRPGFPSHWNEAEIKTPYIGYRWTRAGGVVVTHNPRKFKIDLQTARPKLVGDAMPKPHNRWGHAKGEGSDCSVPAGTVADYVDLSGVCNMDWRLLHAGNYTPRIANFPWSGIPRTLMANGRSWWEWHEVVCNRRGPKDYCIPKSLDWPKDGILSTKFGPAFRLGPKEGKNSVFTSLYDQLPDETSVPLSGKAKKVAFLTAVVTNPNIAWMEAAQVSVEYADGTSATLSLVPPDNCDDWLSYHHGVNSFGRTAQDNKPYAVKGNSVMFGPVAHANVLALALDPSKELKCLRLVCKGTETFAGLIGVTLHR